MKVESWSFKNGNLMYQVEIDNVGQGWMPLPPKIEMLKILDGGWLTDRSQDFELNQPYSVTATNRMIALVKENVK
jgi:hypothetical protein